MRLVQPVDLRLAMVRLLLVPEPEKRLRLLQPVVIRRASGFLARLWVSKCHR